MHRLASLVPSPLIRPPTLLTQPHGWRSGATFKQVGTAGRAQFHHSGRGRMWTQTMRVPVSFVGLQITGSSEVTHLASSSGQ